MPKITIIVPIYKVELTKLEKCINSLVNQTYNNCEIILVDDGSPDECPAVCDKYANTYSNIKVVHQKNKGLSGARNTGVINSTGEWYTFVDGDDYLDSNAIQILATEIESDIDVISSRLIPASKSEDIGNYPYENKKIYSTSDELFYLKKMLINFNGNNNSSCGKLYKKEFTEYYKIYHDEKLKQGAEDLEFNFRVFSKAKKIKIMCNGFYHCVYNENSITRSFNEANEKMKLSCYKSVKKAIIEENENDLLVEYYNRLLYVIVNSAISGFFNPNSGLRYKEKKKLFKEYLDDNDFKYALQHINKKMIDNKRFIILNLIKLRLYFLVNILARIRYNQKKN